MRVLYLPAFVRDLKRLQGAREYARIRRLFGDWPLMRLPPV